MDIGSKYLCLRNQRGNWTILVLAVRTGIRVLALIILPVPAVEEPEITIDTLDKPDITPLLLKLYTDNYGCMAVHTTKRQPG